MGIVWAFGCVDSIHIAIKLPEVSSQDFNNGIHAREHTRRN